MKKVSTQEQRGGPAGGAGQPATAGVDAGVASAHTGSEGRTKHEVARLLLEQGPMTAAAVAERLGISLTAVRRHLDGLVTAGQVRQRDESRHARRGRGRPAKLFLLTEQGRARFGHAYDDLAVAALRYLAEHAGEDAVRAFAERRVAALVDAHRDAVTRHDDPAHRAQALAEALSNEGYAASSGAVGSGEQLCQHHCPVAHVAAEFPQLCEAETAAFAELLGTHVQRLATIARGDAACTTHIPVPATGTPENPVAGAPEDGSSEKTVLTPNDGGNPA